MKAIDELRETADECTTMAGVENKFETVWITKKAFMNMLDEIERELEERYIERPTDKNGEQVHVGDMLHDHEDGHDFRVDGFMLWVSETKWWAFQDQAVQYPLDGCSLVKPPTVEDVLESALNAAAMLDRNMGYWPSAADITNIVNEIAPKLQLREDGE